MKSDSFALTWEGTSRSKWTTWKRGSQSKWTTWKRGSKIEWKNIKKVQEVPKEGKILESTDVGTAKKIQRVPNRRKKKPSFLEMSNKNFLIFFLKIIKKRFEVEKCLSEERFVALTWEGPSQSKWTTWKRGSQSEWTTWK